MAREFSGIVDNDGILKLGRVNLKGGQYAVNVEGKNGKLTPFKANVSEKVKRINADRSKTPDVIVEEEYVAVDLDSITAKRNELTGLLNQINSADQTNLEITQEEFNRLSESEKKLVLEKLQSRQQNSDNLSNTSAQRPNVESDKLVESLPQFYPDLTDNSLGNVVNDLDQIDSQTTDANASFDRQANQQNLRPSLDLLSPTNSIFNKPPDSISENLTTAIQPQSNLAIAAIETAKQTTGSIQLPDGSVKLPDGSIQLVDGSVKLPDGTINLLDSSIILANGSVKLPDGSIKLPDGRIELLDGTIKLLDGSIKLPDGTVKLPDGTIELLDGSVRLLDGSIKLPDGSLQLTDGSIKLPDGTLQLAEGVKPGITVRLPGGTVRLTDGTLQLPTGSTRLPDGSIQLADGSIPLPDGSVRLFDGSIKLPEGSIKLTDGSIQLANGSVKLPDGSVKSPEGSVKLPDGSFQLNDGSIQLPNGNIKLPDGSIKLTDGNIKLPDGSIKLTDGNIKLPDGSIISQDLSQNIYSKLEKNQTVASDIQIDSNPFAIENESYQRISTTQNLPETAQQQNNQLSATSVNSLIDNNVQNASFNTNQFESQASNQVDNLGTQTNANESLNSVTYNTLSKTNDLPNIESLKNEGDTDNVSLASSNQAQNTEITDNTKIQSNRINLNQNESLINQEVSTNSETPNVNKDNLNGGPDLLNYDKLAISKESTNVIPTGQNPSNDNFTSNIQQIASQQNLPLVNNSNINTADSQTPNTIISNQNTNSQLQNASYETLSEQQENNVNNVGVSSPSIVAYEKLGEASVDADYYESDSTTTRTQPVSLLSNDNVSISVKDLNLSNNAVRSDAQTTASNTTQNVTQQQLPQQNRTEQTDSAQTQVGTGRLYKPTDFNVKQNENETQESTSVSVDQLKLQNIQKLNSNFETSGRQNQSNLNLEEQTIDNEFNRIKNTREVPNESKRLTLNSLKQDSPFEDSFEESNSAEQGKITGFQISGDGDEYDEFDEEDSNRAKSIRKKIKYITLGGSIIAAIPSDAKVETSENAEDIINENVKQQIDEQRLPLEQQVYNELLKQRDNLQNKFAEIETNKATLRRAEENIQNQLVYLINSNQTIADNASGASELSSVNQIIQNFINADRAAVENARQDAADQAIQQITQNFAAQKEVDEALLRQRIERELRYEFKQMQMDHEQKMRLVYRKMLEFMYSDLLNS